MIEGVQLYVTIQTNTEFASIINEYISKIEFPSTFYQYNSKEMNDSVEATKFAPLAK